MNQWGINPVEYKVLIEPDEEDEFAGREKFIIKPDDVRDKHQVQKVQGTLIAHGGLAFTNPTWGDPTPKDGDRVYFAKFAGIKLERFVGKDDKGRYLYKHACLCNDRDIAAILHEESEGLEG